MRTPATGGLRVLRALVLLATVTGLVLGGHLAGGGSVTLSALLWLAALGWPVTLHLSRRRVTVPVLALGLAAGQTVGHVLLSTLSGDHGSMTAMCLEHAGHGARAAAACASDTAMASSMSLAPSIGMLLAHLLATAASTVVLARGEALVWRAVDRIVPAFPRLQVRRVARPSLGGILRRAHGHRPVPRALGRAPPLFA